MKLAMLFVLVVVACAYAADDCDLPNEIDSKPDIVRCTINAIIDLLRCFGNGGKVTKKCIMDVVTSFIDCLMKKQDAVTEASDDGADEDLSVIGIGSHSLEFDSVTDFYDDIDDRADTDSDIWSGKLNSADSNIPAPYPFRHLRG